MINDNIKPTGELTIILRDADGNIKLQKTVPNAVVTVGKNLIATRLAGLTGSAPTHMAVGTSSANPTDVTQSALTAEIASSRTLLSTTTTTGAQVNFACTFPAGTGTGAITEAGIFNASTTGTMLCRTVFNSVYKDALDTLTINWAVTIN